jgi:hypothetical protein
VRKRAFGSALTAIATLAVVAACSSSGSQHGTQAGPTQPAPNQASTTTVPATTAALSREFVSKRYGFGVSLPQGWSPVDATTAWGGQYLAPPGSSDWANVSDPNTSRTLMVASAPVPTGMQLAQWRAAMDRGEPSVCAESPSAKATTVGGEPALASTAHCSDGYDVNELVALHLGRGFMIYMPSAAEDGADGRLFEGFRQSFRFTS